MYAAPYAEPPAGCCMAPTIAVSPLSATDPPNAAAGMPSLAVSSCCGDQDEPDRTNTYATPLYPFCPGAPTIAVSPLIATEDPKRSPCTPSLAVSSCCWDQVEPDRTN